MLLATYHYCQRLDLCLLNGTSLYVLCMSVSLSHTELSMGCYCNYTSHPGEPPIQSPTQTGYKCHLFALDLNKAVQRTTQSCHCCTALHQADPKILLKCSRQLILVVRKCITSFTTTNLDKGNTRPFVMPLFTYFPICVPLTARWQLSSVPTDRFKAFVNDNISLHHHLTLELSDAKTQVKILLLNKKCRNFNMNC